MFLNEIIMALLISGFCQVWVLGARLKAVEMANRIDREPDRPPVRILYISSVVALGVAVVIPVVIVASG